MGVNLALLNVVMPGIGGYEVCRRMQVVAIDEILEIVAMYREADEPID